METTETTLRQPTVALESRYSTADTATGDCGVEAGQEQEDNACLKQGDVTLTAAGDGDALPGASHSKNAVVTATGDEDAMATALQRKNAVVAAADSEIPKAGMGMR